MRYKILLAFLTISFFVTSAEWEQLNPKATFLDSKKVQFTTADKGFILTNNALLTTNNGGDTWSTIKEDDDFIDVDFFGTMGVLISCNRIYKTIDDGKSWESIKTVYGDCAKSINIISEDTIFVAYSKMIYKTFDGGKVWQTVDVENYNVRAILFQNSKIGHATCDKSVILKTTNGGLTWQKTYDNVWMYDFSPIYFVDNTTGFTYLEDTGLLKTTNGGNSWEVLRNTGISRKINSFSFLNKDTAFAAGEFGSVFSTIDGGISWKFCGLQSERISDYDISSTSFVNYQKGFVVGLNGRIYKTTNAGMSWSGHSPFYDQITTLSFLSKNTGYCFSNGLYKTDNGGNNWTLITNNHFFTGIQFLNQSLFYGFNFYNLQKTIDGGKNWIDIGLSPLKIDGYKSIYFTSADTGFVSGGYNYKSIFRTTDAGKTWNKVAELAVDKFQFLNSKIGYASIGKGFVYTNIYKTIDGGLTWNGIVNRPNSNLESFDFIDENVGYWLDGNYIHKTIDGGKNWVKYLITYHNCYNIRFFNKDIGYAFINSNAEQSIYKTIDGGVNWTPQKIPVIYNTLSSVCFVDNDIYVGGANGILLKSTVNNAETSIFSIENSYQNKLKIIPNPIQKSFEIIGVDKYPVDIEVFDFAGKCVLAKKITHNRVDLSNFNKGVYTLRIKHENTISTNMLIKY